MFNHKRSLFRNICDNTSDFSKKCPKQGSVCDTAIVRDFIWWQPGIIINWFSQGPYKPGVNSMAEQIWLCVFCCFCDRADLRGLLSTQAGVTLLIESVESRSSEHSKGNDSSNSCWAVKSSLNGISKQHGCIKYVQIAIISSNVQNSGLNIRKSNGLLAVHCITRTTYSMSNVVSLNILSKNTE